MKLTFLFTFVLLITIHVHGQKNHLPECEATKFQDGDFDLKIGLSEGAKFGQRVGNIGDLDGDGIDEAAVCARRQVVGNNGEDGALYILYFNEKGDLTKHETISSEEGGFSGKITAKFATDVKGLGDLDGNGIPDMVVCEQGANDGTGAIWILYMDYKDGSAMVQSQKRIAPENVGGFDQPKELAPAFGYAVENLGDIDGDGITDLAVGTPKFDDAKGNVWILFMKKDGTVKNSQSISDTTGNLGFTLHENEFFGVTLANMGDINNDGVNDLAVGAHQSNRGGNNQGAVYILLLKKDGTVGSSTAVHSLHENFSETIQDHDFMGVGICGEVDFDEDGINDLMMGAQGDDFVGENGGAIYVAYLTSTGELREVEKVQANDGDFFGKYEGGERFGIAICSLGDINGDKNDDFLIGAMDDGDGSIVLAYSDFPTSVHNPSEHLPTFSVTQSGQHLLVEGENLEIYLLGLDGKMYRKHSLARGVKSIDLFNYPSRPHLAIVKDLSGNSRKYWIR